MSKIHVKQIYIPFLSKLSCNTLINYKIKSVDEGRWMVDAV